MTITALTPELEEIAEVAGTAAALAILAAKGGTRVYIPKSAKLGDDHWLVVLVGLEPAEAIADHFGGTQVEIPLLGGGTRGKSWRVLRKALAEGHDLATAARLAGVCVRTARRHKNGHSAAGGGDPRQHRLI